MLWLWDLHERGISRLGLSPVRADGTCRWGGFDLDAHGADDEPRLNDALALLAGLAELGLTGYAERSRGGRGYHVLLLFDEPGVPVADLHRLLAVLAREVPPCEVFPTSLKTSKPLFLPGFGGAPLLDADLHPINPGNLELDNPALVIKALGDSSVHRPTAQWPPKWWKAPAVGGRQAGLPASLEPVRDLLFPGTDGLYHAERGARNLIAGWVAKTIFKRGGTFADFLQWDTENDPPLATDEPKALESWWSWAERAGTRRRAGGRR